MSYLYSELITGHFGCKLRTLNCTKTINNYLIEKRMKDYVYVATSVYDARHCDYLTGALRFLRTTLIPTHTPTVHTTIQTTVARSDDHTWSGVLYKSTQPIQTHTHHTLTARASYVAHRTTKRRMRQRCTRRRRRRTAADILSPLAADRFELARHSVAGVIYFGIGWWWNPPSARSHRNMCMCGECVCVWDVHAAQHSALCIYDLCTSMCIKTGI